MMKSNILIRLAETKDALRIAEFNVRMAEETENEMLNLETVVKGVKEIIKDTQKGFYLVAETTTPKTEIVGQLLVTYEWSDWKNKNLWWLQSVYVATNHRKNKVFSRLFHRLVEMAQIEGNIGGFRLYVEKNNETAKKVYRSLGFRNAPYEMYEMELPTERARARRLNKAMLETTSVQQDMSSKLAFFECPDNFQMKFVHK